MSESIGPRHVLLIWNLLFRGIQPKLSETQPKFSKKQVQPLLDAGLVELEKRGRSTHLVLTEKAWGWSVAHLDAPFSPTVNSAQALAALLAKLKKFIEQTGTPLAEILAEAKPATAPPQSPTLDEKIRHAYLELSGGQWERRVRIAELRELLLDYPPEDQNETLIRMQHEGRLVLYPLDDPQDIFDLDRAAALHIGTEARHIVYMKG